MKKDCLFQYYEGEKLIEDTKLITYDEAKRLWRIYFEQAKNKLAHGVNVQMTLWVNCNTFVSYDHIDREIDYRDCVVEHNRIYKITKKLII